MNEEQSIIPESKESIKLIKNSRGYNWEIKIHIDGMADDFSILRLEDIDKKLSEMFHDKDKGGDAK